MRSDDDAAWLTRRTLIVDDSKTMRKLLTRAFIDAGFAVDNASDGEVALELMRTKQYDLVLMDIEMPVMDGVKSTESIRRWEADMFRGQRQRICALSASSKHESEAQAIGFDHFEQKPPRIQHLLQ
ncbi:CheY-like superfamily, partial [Pelagophyceae sp. CCMP2097]